MVRLFVPPGDGQHPIVPRLLNPLPADEDAHNVPQNACIGAAGWTGLRYLLGRGSPGTFLRATAVIAPFLIVDCCIKKYVQRQGVSHIFKKENIKQNPAKVIEFQHTLGLDSWALGGGIIGLCVAARRKTLPGVVGWKRYLGASQVGWAIGSAAGIKYFQHFSTNDWVLAESARIRMAKQKAFAIQESDLEGFFANLPAIPRFLALYTKVSYWFSTPQMLLVNNEEVRQNFTQQNPALSPALQAAVWKSLKQGDAGISNKGGFRNGNRTLAWSPSPEVVNETDKEIKELTHVSNMITLDAAYVWEDYVAKQHQFFLMPPDEKKLACMLELLSLFSVLQTFSSTAAHLRFVIRDREEVKGFQQKRPSSSPSPFQPYLPKGLPQNWREQHRPVGAFAAIQDQAKVKRNSLKEFVDGGVPQFKAIYGGSEEDFKRTMDMLFIEIEVLLKYRDQLGEQVRKVEPNQKEKKSGKWF